MPQPSREVRFLHSKQSGDKPTITAEAKRKLAQYVSAKPAGEDAWTQASGIPTEAEVGWIENGKVINDDLVLPSAKIHEPYKSKDEYLSTQYRLMRSDGILPLARCINDYRQNLTTIDKDARIYNEVFITSMMVTRAGVALKIEFSATAIGKIIRWAKSKRLRSGTLVALSSDDFNTKCVPAIVASRLLENLEVQSPKKPSVWIYVGDCNQMEIDPQVKWTMIECTQGYWEAYRYTLQALQMVRVESFPMEGHLVDLETDVGIPSYRSKSPLMNLNTIMNGEVPQLDSVNVLEQWPSLQEAGKPSKDYPHNVTSLDSSQIDALKRILTKRLAIIQGPPGTGKTFTSVAAIKILLNNMTAENPPIIIAAQTNHAVDQILRHIAKFEPNFIRLGGQTTDYEVIKPRTLFELKASRKLHQNFNSKTAANTRNAIAAELDKLLAPLTSTEPITADVFFDNNLLTDGQRESINNIESKWAADKDANKMSLWCDNTLTQIINIDKVNLYADDLEEEYENLDDGEIEALDEDSDKFERLYGPTFEFFPGFKCSGRPSGISNEGITKLLAKYQDLQKVPLAYRPAVYDFLRRELLKRITDRVRLLGQRCKDAAQTAKLGKWETEFEFVSKTRVIGLTTTGLSKYRGLLSALNPKIVLIEEAAETLEPYTIAAVFETLEHLILVGDHQQLKANCCCSDLAGGEVNFDVSLFERLVKNQIEFTRLTVQRRMRPGIKGLIEHIYPDLTDHRSVVGRPDINGLNGHNLFFFHHESAETMDESRSKKNEFEARMIVEFTKYLVWNDVCLENITVLTYYNGQKRILKELFKKHELFNKYRVKVCTVDSYQGEENDVVLLSLVRNNEFGNIGFLESVNRACVALSRARLGLYVFGNAKLLIHNDEWATIINYFQQNDCIRSFLPLHCPTHNTEIDAKEYSDLQVLNGGCYVDCEGVLPCGHKCPLRCHPARNCLAEDCEECHSCTVESSRRTSIQYFTTDTKAMSTLVDLTEDISLYGKGKQRLSLI